ncbi:SusC/RagA family TonB-linked outer membrane protein [Ferruginibacter sp.]|nr:TonB-dependent receptor [Ferruginibacter sp.]
MRKILILLLCSFFAVVQLNAQNRTVTGKVTDANGNPVANASVVVKGTSIGTTTATDGTFSLQVNSTVKSLSISSINFGEQQFSIGRDNTVKAILQAADTKLTEVLVVAYGTQKKKEITGAIGRVGGQDIENKPFTSIDKALQGATAGVQSLAASGQPGAAQNIRIRGIGSINAGANPLWVIDGIPVNTGDLSRLTTTSNALSTINPNDVESITVLKDASAASIYGSRAANGVILVTTKKGRSGKTKFKFDSEFGQSDIAYFNEKYRPLNAKQFFDLTREGLINAGTAANAAAADALMTSSFGYGNGADYNWLEGVTQTAGQKQFNLSASGGNEKTTFFISGGYFNQEGLTTQSKFKRYNTNISLTNNATERLKLETNIKIGYVKQNAPLSGGSFGNPVLSSYFLLPSRNPYKADGSFNIGAPDFGTGALHNTLYTNAYDKRQLNQLNIGGYIKGTYKILKGLDFSSQFGIDYNSFEEDQYNNPFHGDGLAAGGRAFSRYTRYTNWTSTNLLNYTKSFLSNDDLTVKLRAGYEGQKSKAYFLNVQAQGFPPTTDLVVAGIGATPIAAAQDASDYSFLSYISDASINYQNRFVVSGSFRRDGSSRFGINNRYGNFWSVGGTWNIDQEKFMENLTFVSQLKLRASYGVNGNASIGNYDWRALYGYGANYNQQPGSAPSVIGNADLTWELNKPLDLGIDVSVLKDRINLTVDYYVRKTSNLLLNEPLSLTSGFGTILKNIGSMENKGVEVTLNLIPVRIKDFEWNLNINYANNKNKITALVNNADILDGIYIRRVGYDFQTFYVRQYAGVDPANGDPLWYLDETKKTTTNVYANALRTANFGSASPKFFGSVTNTLSYKGFSVEAQFYYSGGNYVRDTWGGFYLSSGANGTFNKVVRQLDAWKKAGDVTDIPKYVYGGNKLAQSFSTMYLYKGDYIRLRNLQVGYQFPKTILSKLKAESISLYVRGTNLFTWVKDKNLPFDPEQGIASQTNLEVFIPKTITAGVNIGF